MERNRFDTLSAGGSSTDEERLREIIAETSAAEKLETDEKNDSHGKTDDSISRLFRRIVTAPPHRFSEVFSELLHAIQDDDEDFEDEEGDDLADEGGEDFEDCEDDAHDSADSAENEESATDDYFDDIIDGKVEFPEHVYPDFPCWRATCEHSERDSSCTFGLLVFPSGLRFSLHNLLSVLIVGALIFLASILSSDNSTVVSGAIFLTTALIAGQSLISFFTHHKWSDNAAFGSACATISTLAPCAAFAVLSANYYYDVTGTSAFNGFTMAAVSAAMMYLAMNMMHAPFSKFTRFAQYSLIPFAASLITAAIACCSILNGMQNRFEEYAVSALFILGLMLLCSIVGALNTLLPLIQSHAKVIGRRNTFRRCIAPLCISLLLIIGGGVLGLTHTSFGLDIMPRNAEYVCAYYGYYASADEIGKLSSAETVNISNFDDISLESIAEVDGINRLWLRWCSFEDNALRNMEDLETIDFTYCELTALPEFENLPKLREIEADYSDISDISSLASVPTVEVLSLMDNSLTSADGVENLPKLQKLALSDNDIESIDALVSLSDLESINLKGNYISDISPLAQLGKIKYLNLSHNNISDISTLANLTTLISLNLEKNAVTDLSPIAGLTNLERLYLSGNEISDISPLAGLCNLESLELGSSKIEDFTPLSLLTNLDRLDLSDCGTIKDATVLYPLQNLNYLEIVCASHEDYIALCEALPGCTVYDLRYTVRGG